MRNLQLGLCETDSTRRDIALGVVDLETTGCYVHEDVTSGLGCHRPVVAVGRKQVWEGRKLQQYLG